MVRDASPVMHTGTVEVIAVVEDEGITLEATALMHELVEGDYCARELGVSIEDRALA